jgi:hypothetical protein
MFFCSKCSHRGFHASDGGTTSTCELCPACQAQRRQAAQQPLAK